MEEKKTKTDHFFWSIFGFWNNFKPVFSSSDKGYDSPLFLKKSKGFSLVELLIVIGLIAILMSIGLLTINPAQQLKKNRDSHRKLDLKTIQSALEIYRSDQGSYPTGTTLKSGIITVGNCPTISPTSLTSDDTCADLNAKVYLDTIPKDPFTKKDYYYLPNDSGGYAIYSCLENTGVPSDPKSGDPEALSSATTPPVPDSGSDVDAVLNCNTYYGITNL